MKVSLKTAFSILDGRLSTKMEDIYEMLNYVFSDSLMTHQLPTAMRKLREANPKWFSEAVEVLNDIKKTNNTNDFSDLMLIIDNKFPNYEIELGKIDGKIGFFAGLIKGEE
jgi:hypothetical protein